MMILSNIKKVYSGLFGMHFIVDDNIGQVMKAIYNNLKAIPLLF